MVPVEFRSDPRVIDKVLVPIACVKAGGTFNETRTRLLSNGSIIETLVSIH